MASRKPAKSQAPTLSPADSFSANPPSGVLPPRTKSPQSGGISNLFKPTQWFNRNPSQTRVVQIAQEQPRSSTSSTRKPKISKPTDPRPILQSLKSDSYVVGVAGTRSVLDLSSSNEYGPDSSPPGPGSPPQSPPRRSGGLGDLRNISRKPWSRSADDLGKFSFESGPPSPIVAIDPTFQNRIHQYRKASLPSVDASSERSTPQSPRHQPFPSMPPSPARGPPSPAALLAPAPISTTHSEPGARVHARSNSFTPRLPSKLSAPKLGALVPTPPRRKGSGDSRDREREESAGSAGSRSHSPFPFSLSKAPSSPTEPTAPGLLNPPTIIEPEGAPGGDGGKRSSQIVYQAGFLNRLGNFQFDQHAPYISPGALSKGWKPYKVVLKGSKLYFYKPPSDRMGEVKELFTEGVMPMLEEEGEEEDTKEKVEKFEGAGRKRRAYWGRGTHPELVHADGVVEKGSLEALAHEAVFQTVSSDKEFVSAVVAALPPIVGQAKFEPEFTRCCDYFVSGAADDTSKAEARARVQALAERYLECHGCPADVAAWEDWRRETIPEFPPYSPPGHEGALSPNLDTFSPRPTATERMVALADLIKMAEPTRASVDNLRTPKSSSSRRARIWAMIEKSGLTRETLLLLEPHVVARSLRMFHRQLLEQVPAPLTLEAMLAADGASDCTLSTFLGSDERPHWLTRLVMVQVLGAEGPTGAPRGSSDGARPSQTSRTYKRSELIAMWAVVGEMCRIAGDGCSWGAICTALTARPIARLGKAWKRVEEQARSVVEAWVYEGGAAAAKEPRCTPWGADAAPRLKVLMEGARDDAEARVLVRPLKEASRVFEQVRADFAGCPRRFVPDDEPDQAEELARLCKCWQQISAGEGEGAASAAKALRLDQFMALSLAAEPRHKGVYEPYYWAQPPPTAPPPHPLLPLIFPEALPTMHFIDRDLILRARVDSASMPFTVQDVPFLRGVGLETPRIRHSMDAIASSPQRASFAGPDLGGTVIPVFDGELLVVVQSSIDSAPSRPTSRPSSRPPSSRPPSMAADMVAEKLLSRGSSIRVKTGLPPGVDRKTSLARRSSLPSLAKIARPVSTDVASGRPLRVVVQAGTLDRLVCVLLYGLDGVSVSVADDIGETPLRDGKARELKVDREEFAKIWWNVFRTFMGPAAFFELLRTRYSNTKPLGEDDSPRVLRGRSAVFQVIDDWVTNGDGAQDVLDDLQLFNSVRSFLASEDEPLAFEATPATRAKFDNLRQTRARLMETFLAHTRRPLSSAVPAISAMSTNGKDRGRDVPNIDDLDAEELVDNIDAMASAAFRIVSEEDLFVAADLMEVQTADRIAWFPSHEPNTAGDDIEIQTIHTHLSAVEPSAMIPELGHDSFGRVLPPAVRSCVRAHIILRKWIIARLVSARLGLSLRQARMELILRAIEVCRLRSATRREEAGHEPCALSFAESILTSALLSPESRAHQRAWMNVAAARGASGDSLASLLARPMVQTRTRSPQDELTVDIGWLLEGMLEIISVPNVVDGGSSERPQKLVNFEKRRQLCALINSAPIGSRRRRHKSSSKDLERLNNIEKEARGIQFDLKGVREEAYRESAQVSAGGKRVQRPFQRLVIAQQEKYKRDRYLRDRLAKERRLELRTERRDEQLIRPQMRPMGEAQKQHRNKKSVSAAFNFLMRPISMAWAESASLPTGPRRSIAELDFAPTHKPALVLTVADSKVTKFINNERSFTFQLDTDDGGHYLFQALNRREMTKWLDSINRVSRIAATRRLTWLGDSPRPQIADHMAAQSGPARDAQCVFGVDLSQLLQREAGDADPSPGAIPIVIERCLSEIEARGYTEVGIYRIAGASSEITALKEGFNRGESPINSTTDIHAVCDLVKSWFRVLPDPVFPATSYFAVIAAGELLDLELRLSRLRDVIQGLPRGNFDLLKRISQHLYEATEYETQNQMTARALGIVFTPNLLRGPNNDFAMIMKNMGPAQRVVETLIDHFHVIFDNIEEVEAEEEEPEYETIPEEDEGEDDDDSGIDDTLLAEGNTTIIDDEPPQIPMPSFAT